LTAVDPQRYNGSILAVALHQAELATHAPRPASATAVGALVAIAALAVPLVARRALTLGAAAFATAIAIAILLRLGPVWLAVAIALFLVALLATRFHTHRAGVDLDRGTRSGLDLAPAGAAVLAGAIAGPAGSVGQVVVAAAFSFVLADILGSELGPVYSRGAFLLPKLERVPHGVAGAVSVGGVAAGALGSATAAGVAAAGAGARAAVGVFLGGQLGTIVDTFLMRQSPISLPRRNELVNLAGVATSVLVALVFLVA
jgi:uncharacterized membrane protein